MPHARAPRLTPRLRTGLQILSALLILAGAGLAIWAVVGILQFMARPVDLTNEAPIPIERFVAFLIAGVVLGLGTWLGRLAFLRPIAGLVATEAEPAVEVAAGAVGRGLRQGLVGAASPAVVKVRCRSCGFLETEDARFCSSCRAAL